MIDSKLESDFLRYIISHGFKAGDRLPPLEDISAEMKIGVSKLREQLEVARALGMVEVKQRTGTRMAEYAFLPAVRFSLMFALAQDGGQFQAFSVLRNHIEAAFWYEAVALLTPDDLEHLRALIRRANEKLNGTPIQIPHLEHRDLHLTIFNHLENPFVKGLLEAYWEAYEAVGLNVYSDYAYLKEVWQYHTDIVEALVAGQPERGYQLLVQHTQLLRHRETPAALVGV